MSDSTPIRSHVADFVALGLVSLSLFLGVSVATFDPADPPSVTVYPPNVEVQNACGPLGARVASFCVEVTGLVSIGLAAGLTLLGVQVFLRQSLFTLFRVLLGIFVLILTSSMLLDYLPWSTRFVTMGGAGGTLGTVFIQAISAQVSTFGTLLLLVPSLLGGVVLASGVPASRLLAPLAWLGLISTRTAVAGAKRLAQRRPARPVDKEVDEVESEEDERAEEESVGPEEVAEEVEEEEPEEAEEDEVPIVRVGFDDDEPEVEEETEEDEEEYEEEEELGTAVESDFELPSLDLLEDSEPFEIEDHEQEIRERAKLMEKTFAEFQMKVKVVQIDTGPVVTQYELELEPGLRARKVIALADDIAIALKAPSVRIVAPIPGKNTVGVEVPNARRAKVCLKEVMQKSASISANHALPMYLGKDVKGQPLVYDLAKMPHLLIAGRTGTGKSVCLNTLILSILMTKTPEQVKMLMIDPKMVELSLYKSIPHLMHPVVTDMKKAEAILAWAVEKMESRYSLLARVGVRHIDSYNALGHEEVMKRIGPVDEEESARIPVHMPYILIFADEMADLMMTAAKEVEAHIIRLAQKSRAVGIHLILATQKPTVDVITGLIKSNLPARIAFQVASRTDSRVVLDEMGADKLLGNGDMLFLYPGTSKIVRAQGTFVSDNEVNDVVEFLGSQGKPQFSEELILAASAPRTEDGSGGTLSTRDDMYESAVEVVIREQRGSVSLLQRALGIGYGRAARLVDYMAEDGIVGEYNGAQAREVLIKPEDWDDFRQRRFAKAG